MKTLINGRWTDRKDEKQSNDGSFKRKDTEFRNWITPDGSPGETGVGGFKAESGRYHLYVSLGLSLGPPNPDIQKVKKS